MQAALFREFGDHDVLKLEEVPTPKPGPGQLLIKILATGVNRLEHYLREGSVLTNIPLPHVLGSDASGVVEAIGEGVTGFTIGERVIPMPGYPLDESDYGFEPICAAPSYAIGGIVQWGTYAQYVAVPAKWVVKDSTGLTPEEAATLPMVLVTGVRAVKSVGGVSAGDSVLVHAGASGTGSMNLQIAKALGARVATTVDSGEKADFARLLGADLVIDVRETDFVDAVKQWTGGRGADVVIDNLGGTVLPRSLDAVRTLGVVVAMGFVTGVEATFHVRNFFFAHKTLRGTLMGTREDMEWGLARVKDGSIKPLLDAALPLSGAAEAHRRLKTNATLGNIVLRPWN